MPYRLPAPGYILLQSLRNDAEGGESTLVDGLHVAETMRRKYPAAFALLTAIATRFRYADPDTVLEYYGALIELAPDGTVPRLRFNNRTEEAPALAPERLAAYYDPDSRSPPLEYFARMERAVFARAAWDDAVLRKGVRESLAR